MYGEKIREARKKHGLTLMQLAARLNISHSTLSYYERDQAEVPANRLIAIARALNVSIFELTGYEKKPEVDELLRLVKQLPLDRLLEAVRDRLAEFGIDEGTRRRALRYVELLHGKRLEPWQVDAINAILGGREGDDKEEV